MDATERDDPRDQLAAFLRGDADETRAVERILEEVVRARGFGLDPSEQEDLRQEALTQLWVACAREGFALTSSLGALARRIATARCIDYFRRRRWQVELDEALPADTADPLDGIDAERRSRILRLAVQSLKPLCRELIERHFEQEQSYEEIARSMNRVASTLRVHMHRCIRALRGQMLGEGKPS